MFLFKENLINKLFHLVISVLGILILIFFKSLNKMN
jgi:hypothetical protein